MRDASKLNLPIMGEKKTIDSRTWGRIRPRVKPQIRDPSNKVPTSKDFTRSIGLSISSKIRILCSYQINHMRHADTIFQIFENCFPNQFLEANSREAKVLGITHWIPNNKKTSLHKACTQSYSGAKDGPQFPHHIYTSNQLTS